MKLPALFASVLSAALLGLVLANTYLSGLRVAEHPGAYRLEVRATATAAGTAQLFYDAGRGITEADSARATFAADTPVTLVFPITADAIRALRFDPVNNDARVTLTDALLRGPDGRVFRRFTPADFATGNQIETLTPRENGVVVQPPRGANDPFLHLALGTESLTLTVPWHGKILPFVWRGLPWSAGLIGLVLAWHFAGAAWQAKVRTVFARMGERARARPRTAVALVAGAAMLLSNYPVIFCGASFVSPNYGTTLLYDAWPTLPASEATTPVDPRGADVGAIMWQQVPLSAVQSRALLQDFELPLWNRYNSGGTILLGQGQTMFGDPLHFGVILAGGAAWAWDLKFLAAKWLLGLVLGLTVLHLTRHLAAALLVAFASIFAGFFLFRVNHPAFFSFCYGPLVLYAWCHLSGAATRRGLWGSLLGLIVANGMLLTSGTAKEAYVSLFTLNFAGAAILLFSAQAWRKRLLRLAAAGAAGVVFMLLSAPVWLTFLDGIRASYSSYGAGVAYQLSPALILGSFDELLFRPLREGENVQNPSSNFVILLGVIAALVNLRALLAPGPARGLLLGLLFAGAFVFGLVPGRLIVDTPFLGGIHHINNSFSLGFIHLSALLAGLGFASAARRLGTEEGRHDLQAGLILLGALVALYVGTVQIIPGDTYTGPRPQDAISVSRFVGLTLAVQLGACLLLAVIARRALVLQRLSLAALLATTACLTVLLWRHSLHLQTQFPKHTLHAAPRVSFDAVSPALETLRRDSPEPSRVTGFGSTFFHGWNDVYALEGVGGPDALMNAHMRELQSAFGVERIWDWRIIVEPATLPRARAFYDLLNVRYYLGGTGDPAPAGDSLTLLTRADLAVWRSETAWPRAFFTNRVATYRDAADFAALVRANPARPLAAVQAGEKNLPPFPPGDPSGRTVVPASSYRLTNNTTSFTVQAPAPGVIVLGEAWLKGEFTATVNGRPAPLFRVNHAFKGLAVPQGGAYEVTIRYRPHRFNLSLGLSGLGLAITIATGWWAMRPLAGSRGSG